MSIYQGSALRAQVPAPKKLTMKKLRALVFKRAGGKCECGCGYPIDSDTGRLDHFFGRAKAPETIENCWALSIACDEGKTGSRPTAVMWCDRFYIHAIAYGYHDAAERAATKATVLSVKGFA